jgi:hypothetical protein
MTMQGVIREAATEPLNTEEGQETSGDRREGSEPSKRESPDRGDIR